MGRECHWRHFDLGKALRFITDPAVKVDMRIAGIVAFAGVAAYGVFYRSGPVVDAVNNLVLLERFERSEQGHPIRRLQSFFQIFQADRMVILFKKIQHQQSHRRRFYLPSLKLLFQMFAHVCQLCKTKIHKSHASVGGPTLTGMYLQTSHRDPI